MRPASRLRSSQLASVAGLFGAALLLAPPPAAADRDDWEHRGRHRHHGGHRHHHHGHHGKHHGHGHAVRTYAYYEEPVWYGPPPHAHRARFFCEPCGHWYDDRPSFHRHVHHHHHVPLAVIPLVVLATVFGAVFAGY